MRVTLPLIAVVLDSLRSFACGQPCPLCRDQVMMSVQRPRVRRAGQGDSRVTGNGTGTVAAPTGSRGVRRAAHDRPDLEGPRLAVGVVIVAACALLGARLLGGADDSVAVWAVRTDLAEGAALDPGALEPQEVRFASPEAADRYLSGRWPPRRRGAAARARGRGAASSRGSGHRRGGRTGRGPARGGRRRRTRHGRPGLGRRRVGDAGRRPRPPSRGGAGARRRRRGGGTTSRQRPRARRDPAGRRRAPAEDEGELPEALSGVASGAVVIVGQG